jgi:hypothetical protein
MKTKGNDMPKFTRTSFAAHFSNEDAAAEYAILNGWTLETTERMERGVWAVFSA